MTPFEISRKSKHFLRPRSTILIYIKHYHIIKLKITTQNEIKYFYKKAKQTTAKSINKPYCTFKYALA